MNFGLDNYNEMVNHFGQTCADVLEVNKTGTKKIELTNIQLFDDVSVTLEIDTLPAMEHWAYKTEDDLAYNLFDAERAYEDGKRDNLCIYTEDELNDMMVRAGLITNLFDKYSDTYALSLAIIKKCVRFLDILHGEYKG